MKKWIIYGVIAWLSQSCSTPKEIFVNDEFEANNRSSAVELRFLKDNKAHLLGYRIFRDTVIKSSQDARVSNMGILFPRNTVTEVNRESESVFGSDSLKCTIHYHVFYKLVETKPSALHSRSLSKAEQEPKESITEVDINGYLYYPGIDGKIPFAYKNHVGFLLTGSDSLRLTPVYQGHGKLAQTLIGVQLLKGDAVYGVVNSFTGIGRKKAYLYTKATSAEQMIIAAYFAVVASYL